MSSNIKNNTHFWHDRLEAHELLSGLMSEQITLQLYQTVLERFYGFYKPIEDVLLSQSYLIPDELAFHQRLKAPAIIDDLIALEQDITLLPLCQDLPDLNDQWSCLGCVYVMEGATLGGQIITRHLLKHLPLLTHNQANKFFRSYEQDVGIMWKSFQQILAQYTDFEAEISVGANQTYEKLYAWLDTGFDA